MAEKHPSLFCRLVCRTLGLVAVLVVVVLATFYFSLSSTVDNLTDRSLHGQAHDISVYLEPDTEGNVVLNLPPSLADDYSASKGEYVYVIMDADKNVLAASDTHKSPLNKSPDRIFRTYDPERNHDYYGATIAKELGGKTYYIQVAQGPKHDDVLLDTLIEEMAEEWGWLLLAFAGGFMVIITVTIRTTLKPIIRASDEAQGISPKTTDIRISEQSLPQEVLPLVQGMNAALDRLEAGFKQQREFTANAAHELRTPLAVLKANLDNLKEKDVAEKLTGDVDRMGRLVSQLLKVAQLESFALNTNEKVDLKEVATEVAAHLAPLALKEDKSIEVEGSTANVIEGNKEALIHAVRNLAENALQHTPENTAVCIDVSKPGRLTVSDKGPGVPEQYRAEIFQRFWRDPDKSKRTGSGLGLSIVATTMEQHKGEVTVNDTESGGAAFSLIFPEIT